MKKHVKQVMLIVFTAVLLIAGAVVTMIVGYADESPEYRTVRVEYYFENGKTAHDPYIAVFKKGASIDTTVINPIIKGYRPVDSLEDNANPAPETKVKCTLNDNLKLNVYYLPESVPYSVKYFLQDIYDDNYKPALSLDKEYGLTGTFPDKLENVTFDGFTKLYHKPDFIAADGSTEFELYYNRNYYLIDFNLDGGHGVDSVYAKYESNFNINEPKKEGYVFQGWIECDSSGNPLDENENPKKFTSGKVKNKTQHYKAVWAAAKVNYSITYLFETVDGSGIVNEGGKNYEVVATKEIIEEKFSGDTVSAENDFYDGINVAGLYVKDIDTIIERVQAVYPDMSNDQVKALWNKERFTYNDTISSKDILVKGDGTTRVYVYYDRKVYKQRFFFCRERVNEDGTSLDIPEENKYEVAGFTKSFSMTDTEALGLDAEEGLRQHFKKKSSDGALNAWQQIIEEKPSVWPELESKVKFKKYPETGALCDNTNSNNNYVYWYYEFNTKYGENMHNTWLQHAFKPINIKKSVSNGDYYGHSVGFGAWSVEWNAYYPNGEWEYNATHRTNRTCKGIYETLDEYLMRKDNEQTLNYLAFWTDAKNDIWNGRDWKVDKTTTNPQTGRYGTNPQDNQYIYIFNYLNYVEVLPEEVEYVKEHINDEIWTATDDDYNMLKAPFKKYLMRKNEYGEEVYYKLYNDQVIETYDAGNQYISLKDRDANVKSQQTHSKLVGFNFLEGKTEIDWSKGQDEQFGLNVVDVTYFYERQIFVLNYSNHGVKSSNLRRFYYGQDISKAAYANEAPEFPVSYLRPYKTFEGWYHSPLYKSKVDFNTFRMPAGDVTIYAKWDPAIEHVTFYSNYGTYLDNVALHEADVPYNTLMLTNDIPTTIKDGKRPYLTPPTEGATFVGWYFEDETGAEKRFEPELIPVTGDMKLFAKWTSTKTADYRVEYVKAGTNTPVADPTTGIAYVSATKSFKAKAGDELYADYQPGTGHSNWWPAVNSHSILIKPNGEGDNTFRFEYSQKGKVWYKVRYLDAITLQPLFDDKEDETELSVVSEAYLAKSGYIPDRVIKTLNLSASTNEDSDKAKEEELAANIIVFLYTRNTTHAPVRVEHWLQKADGNPDNPADYNREQTEKFDKPLGYVIDFSNDIYGSEIAKEYKDNHYIINEKLTEVNDKQYKGEEVKVDGNQLVIKVYYKRNNYPYKVLYVDLDQEMRYNESQGQITDNGVLGFQIYGKEESERKPMGAVVDIPYPKTLNVGGIDYYPITDDPHTLTIYHEDFNAEDPDPKVNVEKVYYSTDKPRWHIHYEKVCVNPIGEVDEDFAYLLPDNKEIFTEDTQTMRGCEAIANPDYGDRYTFLGWYRSASLNQDDFITDTAKYIPDRPEQKVTYFYALFKMNYAPYTLDYVYQGRKGGNTGGSYVGDDAATDEKHYTVNVKLEQKDVDENGMPKASVLVDKAPAVEDLYKKCVWTINDEHVVFDRKNRTVKITADQSPMLYTVKFYYNNDIYDVERVQLNSQVMPNGRYVQAPNTDSSGKPFAYWFVEENGREVAKCYDRNFNLRITGDSIVTACYGETAKSVTISNAEYSREQYTDPKTNKPVDKLYADFIAAYMDKQGTMLNPAYTATPNVATPYQTGLIIQYSQNQKVTKPDEPGAKLAEGDKKVFPQSDVLTKENAKLIAEGKTLNNGYTYHVAAISNSKYNNRNRINKPLSFNNTESARHLVLCAYYYVLNTKTNDFEMSEPVYFYLYDIGNSVVEK